MPKPSSGTPATVALEAAGTTFKVHTYDPAALDEGAATYGEAVAAVLGVDAQRLFKTLLAEVDGAPCVAVVPVSARLSTKALARAAGGKRAELLAPEVAERLTGYVTGGISPVGQKRALPTFIDESAQLWDTVFVSGGKRGLQLELAAASLASLCRAKVLPLAV
jgi:Cys-tRNA(Pro)/Cys-tRNA(Cys) deacylase